MSRVLGCIAEGTELVHDSVRLRSELRIASALLVALDAVIRTKIRVHWVSKRFGSRPGLDCVESAQVSLCSCTYRSSTSSFEPRKTGQRW